MPRLHLTKRNIDTTPFPPKGQVDYFDTGLKGLALRVGRDVKTFFVQIDVLDQVSQKHRTVTGKIGRGCCTSPKNSRGQDLTPAPCVAVVLSRPLRLRLTNAW